jgi:hypothetical protein
MFASSRLLEGSVTPKQHPDSPDPVPLDGWLQDFPPSVGAVDIPGTGQGALAVPVLVE